MKVCKNCNRKLKLDNFHIDKKSKDNHSNVCKDCRRIYNKKTYKDNKEKIKSRASKYRIKNKEKIKNKNKKYYEKNKEKILLRQKEYSRNYYQENKEKESERKRKYYEKNRDLVLARTNQYYQNNKEYIKDKAVKNKRKLRQNDQYRLAENIKNIVRQYINRGCKLGKQKTTNKYGINVKMILDYVGAPPKEYKVHLDHIIPVSCFNFNDEIMIQACFLPENHQWLKSKDNLRKSNKIIKNNKFFKAVRVINSFLIKNGRDPMEFNNS